MPRRSDYRITGRSVEALRARGRDYLVWDRDLPGFGVRVSASGRKVYVVQTRGPAGSRRATVGRVGELSVTQARRRAALFVGRIKTGAEPLLPTPVPEEPTVAELAARYLRVHVEVNCKASTVARYRSIIGNHILPALGEMKIGAVRHGDVAKLHHALQGKPATANAARQVLSQMFRKAERWRLLPDGRDPCRNVRKYALRTRERYLTRDEYRRLGRVLKDGEAHGLFAGSAVAALRLLILTGCRRDEMLTLRWDDVDFSARELRLRDTKTGPRFVALTAPVAAVLRGIPRLPGNPWVFVGGRSGSRLMTLRSTWRRVRRLAELGDMRLHDLRHSYASRALAEGESLTMIGKLLNHAQMQTTARYTHLMLDAERTAAARVGDAIGSQLLGRRGRAAARPMIGTEHTPDRRPRLPGRRERAAARNGKPIGQDHDKERGAPRAGAQAACNGKPIGQDHAAAHSGAPIRQDHV